MVRDFQELGGTTVAVSLHRFPHQGRSFDNVEAELPGRGSDEVVLVTAHLDSTAANDDSYDPKTDEAPGKDDDASGSGGVLAIARAMVKLAQVERPKRTIRFVLFNAEEQGLVGSAAYAKDQAALGLPIVAICQMDMIGYNVNRPRSFELHVGISRSSGADERSDVEERSLRLVRMMEQVSRYVSPGLETPQIYASPDPAAGRSDHSSFQRRGYAACLAAEDFFPGPLPDPPEAEPNPNYHTKSDTFVDLEYAADIARIVAGAVWIVANA